MDEVQERFERAVVDQFLDWYNSQSGSRFQVVSRGESPDFEIADSSKKLAVEVTSAYYDPRHAQFLWHPPRNVQHADTNWSGVNLDAKLIQNIFRAIESKAAKPYALNCILLIYVQPGITSFDELTELFQTSNQPYPNPFHSIYVVGSFPYTESSSGGGRVICVSSQSS